MAKSNPEIFNTITGAILSLTGIIAAVGGFTDTLNKVHNSIKTAPPMLIWIAIGALIFIGLYLLWRGLSRKSRLLRPEVFLIDPDNPRHLKGRDDDIRTLRDAVNYPLVFLEGESGAGKSALIRSGLIPALTSDEGSKTLLPLYINTYGGDWETGPETQLAHEMWVRLSESQRKQLNINNFKNLKESFWSKRIAEGRVEPIFLFDSIQNEFGITPLLIFDQFDDYQIQHRDKFLRKGKWINVKQLTVNKTTRNEFWVKIREALQRNSVRCLFITRDDALGGLEPFRFIEAKVCYLFRIDPIHLTALIEEIVSQQEGERPVIADPQAGWDTLKKRLVKDLAYQGKVLPIQARAALKGLTKLAYLSVANYERAGMIEGLEAAYIEDGVKAAANLSDVNRNIVIRVLLELVDKSKPESPKTRSRSQYQLGQNIGVLENALPKIRNNLEPNGLVRARVDKDPT